MKIVTKITERGEKEIYRYDRHKNIIYSLIDGIESYFSYNIFGKMVLFVSGGIIVKDIYRWNKLKHRITIYDGGYKLITFDKFGTVISKFEHNENNDIDLVCEWKRINNKYVITYMSDGEYCYWKRYNKYGNEIYHFSNDNRETVTEYQKDGSRKIYTKILYEKYNEILMYNPNNILIYKEYITPDMHDVYKYDDTGECISESHLSKI